jgi:hypothetical protein
MERLGEALYERDRWQTIVIVRPKGVKGRFPPEMEIQRTRFPVSISSSVIVAIWGLSVDPVASLLVKSGFCRIRFWYAVAPGSGISRETSRNYFWNLTVEAGGERACSAAAAASRRVYWPPRSR